LSTGVHIVIWKAIQLSIIIALNFSPVSIYARAEFWFASPKAIMITGLLILSFILFWSGGPYLDRIGFRCRRTLTETYLIDKPEGHFNAFLDV